MKKLMTIALVCAAAMTATTFIACDKGGGEPGPQIEVPEESELTQQAYADEQTTGGFTFIAKSTWTATVTEPETTRASDVAWLRLLSGGEEKYSGAAGTFTLAIELDPNYTGVTREAMIVIISGADKITVWVRQDGKTVLGTIPEDPVHAPKPDAAYFGTWIIMGHKNEAAYWENATISMNRLVYRSADGDGYTLENLTWTAAKMPPSDTNGDAVIDSKDDTGYSDGYKLTGKLTANPGGRKLPKADGGGFAVVGDMAAEWWFINAAGKDALLRAVWAEPNPGEHYTAISGPYVKQAGDNPEKPEYNKFTIDGKSLGIIGGEMQYYGDEYSAAAENVLIGLFPAEYPDWHDEADFESDFWVALDMLVPDGGDRLAAGRYTFGNSHAPYTFTADGGGASGAVDEVKKAWREMTGGTVKVSVSGTGGLAVYTIAVDCTLTGGGTVKGTYHGPLAWSDETE